MALRLSREFGRAGQGRDLPWSSSLLFHVDTPSKIDRRWKTVTLSKPMYEIIVLYALLLIVQLLYVDSRLLPAEILLFARLLLAGVSA